MQLEPKPDNVPTEKDECGRSLNRRAMIASAGLIGGVGALGLNLGERSAIAAVPSTQAIPGPESIDAFPPSPGPVVTWEGLNMLHGGKGYAPAPLGQMHYRDVGPRDAKNPLLLMHQTPATMIEFGAIQNSCAKLGIRSIAPDTPGYGLSDQSGILPTVAGFADNFIYLLDHLKLDKVVVVGHHTGTSFATSIAARHPDRVAGIILHGTCLYDAALRKELQGEKEFNLTPKEDGSHLLWLFRLPAKRDTKEQQVLWTLMTVMSFMEGPDTGHWAINRYDMEKDLAALKTPGLIITEPQDHLHDLDLKAHALRPDFAMKTFGGGNFPGIFTDPDGWAKIAAEWLGTTFK